MAMPHSRRCGRKDRICGQAPERLSRVCPFLWSKASIPNQPEIPDAVVQTPPGDRQGLEQEMA